MEGHACNSRTWRYRQEGEKEEEFTVILSYIVSSRRPGIHKTRLQGPGEKRLGR